MRKLILPIFTVLLLCGADQVDKAFQGRLPSAVNQIACSTDGATANWTGASTCGLATVVVLPPESMAAYSDGLGAGISGAAKVGYHKAVVGGTGIYFHGIKTAGGNGTGSGKATVYDLYDETTTTSFCTFTVGECNLTSGNDAIGTEYTPTCSGTVAVADKIVVRVVSTTCTTAGDVMINAGWR